MSGQRIAISGAMGLALVLTGCQQGMRGGMEQPASQSATGQAVAAPRADAFDLPDISLVRSSEVDLVEKMVESRAAYHRGLIRLREFYDTHGYAAQTHWAATELDGLEHVKSYHYIDDNQVLAESLRPVDSIPDADALYEQGTDLMQQGGHGVPAPIRQDILARAYRTFVDLIRRHPTSDKIDDAAFQAGLILEEHFPGEEALAVRWYRRAAEWDPKTPYPALFRAAGVYDFRLNDRDSAIDLYAKVVNSSSANQANVRWARRRIDELAAKATPAALTPETRTSEPAPRFGTPLGEGDKKPSDENPGN